MLIINAKYKCIFRFVPRAVPVPSPPNRNAYDRFRQSGPARYGPAASLMPNMHNNLPHMFVNNSNFIVNISLTNQLANHFIVPLPASSAVPRNDPNFNGNLPQNGPLQPGINTNPAQSTASSPQIPPKMAQQQQIPNSKRDRYGRNKMVGPGRYLSGNGQHPPNSPSAIRHSIKKKQSSAEDDVDLTMEHTDGTNGVGGNKANKGTKKGAAQKSPPLNNNNKKEKGSVVSDAKSKNGKHANGNAPNGDKKGNGADTHDQKTGGDKEKRKHQQTAGEKDDAKKPKTSTNGAAAAGGAKNKGGKTNKS